MADAETTRQLAALLIEKDRYLQEALLFVSLLVHKHCNCWRCQGALALLEKAREAGHLPCAS